MNLLNATGISPVLLSASDEYLFIGIIFGGLSVFVLAPLFSLIFLFTRRGHCKWLAIIFTMMLLGIDTLLGERLLPGSVSMLPELCLALIATGFWRRIDNRRYGWVSLIWAILTIRFLSRVFHFLLYALALPWPGSPALRVLLLIVPTVLLTTMAGLIVMNEMKRRRLRLPDPVQLVGFGIVATLADAIFSQAIVQIRFHYAARFSSGVSIPVYWPQLGYAAVAGALGAILAWVIVQNRPARDGIGR